MVQKFGSASKTGGTLNTPYSRIMQRSRPGCQDLGLGRGTQVKLPEFLDMHMHDHGVLLILVAPKL